MSLSKYRLNASVAVSDMGPAREFYEARLGLTAEREGADGSRVYPCGGDTALHVYHRRRVLASRARRWPPGTWTTSSASSTSWSPTV
jgi:hypothetical protein